MSLRKYIYPAIGIIIATLLVLLINEFAENSAIMDYFFLIIIAGMLLGWWIETKLISSKKTDD